MGAIERMTESMNVFRCHWHATAHLLLRACMIEKIRSSPTSTCPKPHWETRPRDLDRVALSLSSTLSTLTLLNFSSLIFSSPIPCQQSHARLLGCSAVLLLYLDVPVCCLSLLSSTPLSCSPTRIHWSLESVWFPSASVPIWTGLGHR